MIECPEDGAPSNSRCRLNTLVPSKVNFIIKPYPTIHPKTKIKFTDKTFKR